VRPVSVQAPVLVDRDGVINRNHVQSVHGWDEFEFLPGALSGLARLAEAGHQVVIVTNQADVGRGLMTPAQLDELHRRMQLEVEKAGGAIHGIYACTHTPEDGCDCRKPAPGLLKRAAAELGFELGDSYVIGDHQADVQAAHAAGAKAVLVLSGRTDAASANGGSGADHVAADLATAADLVIEMSQARRGTSVGRT
jgi:histidinol-phosphate phosphatase family protein